MGFEWPQKSLGDILKFANGKSSPNRSESGKFVVYGSNGPIGRADLSNAPDNTIVVGRVGSYCGSTYLARQQCWVTDNAIRANPRGENDAFFALYLLKSLNLNDRRAGSGQPLLNQSILTSIDVYVPPIAEQRMIGTLLGSLDDRIDLLRQTNTTLEAIAQALFKSWFVDFDPVHVKAEGREPEAMDAATATLFPSEFEESELGLIPKGWRVMPLLDACDLQGGTQPPASTFIDEPKAGYVRLLQIRDFSTNAHLTYIPESKKLRTAQVDDILIGRYGSASGNKQKDSLGRICRGLEGAYNVALMKLVPGSVGREFAFQVFNDQNFYNYLQGVSAKAVQSGFSKKELALYKIVVPDGQVLERYEAMGSAVWEQVKLKRQRIATLAQLRDTLLPRLISGKLRLPEATEAPETDVAGPTNWVPRIEDKRHG